MTNKLANQIARDIQDISKSELDVGGFNPFDCYSVKDGANPNEFLVEAGHPGDKSQIFVVSVRISSSRG